MPRTKFLVGLVTSGATLVGSAAAFASSLREISYPWTILGLSVLALLSLVWLYVFISPGIKKLGEGILSGLHTDAQISSRIIALEENYNQLSQFVSASHKLLNLSEAVHFTVATSDGMTLDVASRRIRANLAMANRIAESVSQFSDRESFEEIIRDTTGLLIVLARSKGMTFDSLAALLLSEIPPRTARTVVDVSAVVEAYGASSATQWQSMVGSP